LNRDGQKEGENNRMIGRSPARAPHSGQSFSGHFVQKSAPRQNAGRGHRHLISSPARRKFEGFDDAA
jgi:hypothetical protein